MFASVLTLVVVVLFLPLAYWYQYRRRLMDVFKRLNIPGPEPNIFYGNLKEFLEFGPNVIHEKWTKKYGKVFGWFFGGRPVIVVGDIQLLRQILIKDFHKFGDRPVLVPGGNHVLSTFQRHLIRQKGAAWKKQRAILSPSFTSGKLKQTVPILRSAIEEFMENIETKNKDGKEFDIYEMYKALTLDVIGRAAFGIHTRVQKDLADPFLLAANEAFSDDTFSGTTLIATCFPEFSWLLVPIRSFFATVRGLLGYSRLLQLAWNCEEIVKTRRSNPQNRRMDLLQLMLDGETTQKEIDKLNGTTGADLDANGPKKTYRINDIDIISNTFLALIAGYDTISTVLGFTTYFLVKHPHMQEKARQEVRRALVQDGSLEYNNVMGCKYLDHVLRETMRYHAPTAGVVAREASEEVHYGNLIIPRGFAVQVSNYIHKDPDYWTNPDTFDPDRFSDETSQNHSNLAFQVFGAGPRNCIGMRFALMEAKLALANLLLNYRLLPGDSHEKEVELICKLIMINPKNGIYIKAERLQEDSKALNSEKGDGSLYHNGHTYMN